MVEGNGDEQLREVVEKLGSTGDQDDVFKPLPGAYAVEKAAKAENKPPVPPTTPEQQSSQ